MNIPKITFPARVTASLLIHLFLAAAGGLLMGGIFYSAYLAQQPVWRPQSWVVK